MPADLHREYANYPISQNCQLLCTVISQDVMDRRFRGCKPNKDTGQEMHNSLEADNPFEYTRDAISAQHNATTRLIMRRKGNSESEDKQVLLALDLASLLSCPTNNDGANISQRRRAQNRASQRAFRERKRSHTEDLQQQLDKLHETHRFLQETYQQNVDELSNMKAYVDKLSFEINMLQMQPGAQQDYFDRPDSTAAWKTPKLKSPPSYFDVQSEDLNTPRDYVMGHPEMERVFESNPAYSPSTASSSTGAELIWS